MLWSADGQNSAVVGLIVCAAIGEGRTPMTKNASAANEREIRTVCLERAAAAAAQSLTAERTCRFWATSERAEDLRDQPSGGLYAGHSFSRRRDVA